MTLPVSKPDPAIEAEVRAANRPGMKDTIVVDEDGEWVWVKRPTPAQDSAYVAKCYRERDAALSCAKRLSKLAVGYARGAAIDTNPERAARWITEASRLRREARSHLAMARRKNI